MAWTAAALGLLALVACVAGNETVTEPDALSQVTEAINVFSTDLFLELLLKPGNLIVSPMSASAALALMLQGAGGHTAQQLQKALRLPAGTDVKNGFKKLFTSLRSVHDAIVRIADRVFVKKDANIKAPFRSTAVDDFYADVQELDFADDNEASRETINSWVEENTDYKIRGLLAQLDPATLMMVVNAIYFKGTWLATFSVKDEPFYESTSSHVSVPMMHTISRFRHAYVPQLRVSVLELPYMAQSMKMWVILPDLVNGLARVEQGLMWLNFADVKLQMSLKDVSVSLPKFKIESTFQLHETLPELGVRDLFEPDANLTGITDVQMQISQMIHRAFVEVTEEETVATAAKADAASMDSDRITFKADHPFLFYVLHKDVIVVMGRYTKARL